MAIKYFAVAAVFTAAAFAQGNLGGFTGTVIDTSTASVPEAKLTFTSYQTNSVHSVVADSKESIRFVDFRLALTAWKWRNKDSRSTFRRTSPFSRPPFPLWMLSCQSAR